MNPEQYKVMLETFLRIELLVSKFCCFQQDGATAHTAEISVQVLRSAFLGRLISRFQDITFPACWPDHGVPHYFVYVKSRVYGLGVACWPLVPKFAGSNPAEAVGFLGRKNPQHAFLWRGSKAVSPMS